ncbi:TPA: hypothetical protein ACH3X3_002462 [Trebouxia sp. C0006]
MALLWLEGVAPWAAATAACLIAILCYCLSQHLLGEGAHWDPPLPPKARTWPFIGTTFEYLQDGPSSGAKYHKQLGNIYRSWLLGEKIIHVGDGDACKLLMTCEHDLVEGEWPYTIATLIGSKALNTAHGKRHFQLRKIMAPAFVPEASLQYIARTVEIAELHCQQWAELKQVSGEHAVKDFTFHVATELVIGFPTSFLTEELLARQKCLFLAWLAGFVALPINLPGFAFHKALLAKKALMAEFKDHILRMMANLDRPLEGRPKACMQMLLEASRANPQDLPPDMDFVQENCLTLLFAAHDTTASALTMLLRYLKEQPNVLQKLRAEQRQVICERGSKLNKDTLAIMPYADATIKEALRLGAVINIVPKRALKTFEIGGYTIPKGYRLQLELWKVLLEDSRWIGMEGPMAPSQFNPARWLNKEGRSSQMGSWVPFSAGPRMCIGYSFALQEIKILLAILARKYDWDIDLTEPLKTFPLPYPARGLPMTFTEIETAALQPQKSSLQ